jgi:hypothetical protein
MVVLMVVIYVRREAVLSEGGFVFEETAIGLSIGPP